MMNEKNLKTFDIESLLQAHRILDRSVNSGVDQNKIDEAKDLIVKELRSRSTEDLVNVILQEEY